LTNPTCKICLNKLEDYYEDWLEHCERDHSIGDYLPFYSMVKEKMDKDHLLPQEQDIYEHLDLALKEFDDMAKQTNPRINNNNLSKFRNQLVGIAVRLCYVVGSDHGFNS